MRPSSTANGMECRCQRLNDHGVSALQGIRHPVANGGRRQVAELGERSIPGESEISCLSAENELPALAIAALTVGNARLSLKH